MCFNEGMQAIFMGASFTWIDFVVVVLAIVMVWQGMERGLGDVWAEFLALVVGMITAMAVTPAISSWLSFLQITYDAVFVLVYVGILSIVTYVVLSLAKKVLALLPRQYFQRRYQFLWSIIPVGGVTLLVVSLLVVGLLRFYPWGEIGEAVVQSLTYRVYQLLGEIPWLRMLGLW